MQLRGEIEKKKGEGKDSYLPALTCVLEKQSCHHFQLRSKKYFKISMHNAIQGQNVFQTKVTLRQRQ